VNGTNVLDLGELSPPQLTGEYLRWRREYRDLIKRAIRVSRGSGGIEVDGHRLAYASVLFTRICVIAKSVERLLPDCKPKEHWDFSATASLARNLAEAYLWYYWLCEDEVDSDVCQGRFILLCCHDHGSRGRMFPNSIPTDAQDVVTADLIRKFDANPYLKTFDEKARREALRGHKTPFVQDDVIEAMGADKDKFRFLYRFFSQHTHTGPVAFFRMLEHDRGTGVETAHEKQYMIVATMFASAVLEAAIEGHLKLFPDAETRQPYLTDNAVIRNVERNQGRSRRAHRQ
jgi:hypothetical protein